MKKIILATAIATLSTSAFAAKEESKPTIDVYGHLNIAYQHDNFSSYWTEGKSDLFDNASTIGLYAEHEVAPGINAFARIEVDSSGLTDSDGVDFNSDEVYVGLQGRYGRIWVGKDDSFMEEKVDRTAHYYETVGLHAPFAQYNWEEADRVKYESALLPSYGGGLLQFNASINRSDAVDPFTGKVDQEIGYEVGVNHATDRFEISGVVSSNKNIDGNGTNSGNHAIGLFGSAKVTEQLTLSANFIHNEGNSDLPYGRYYSVMTNYVDGKFRYTVSYENGEMKYDDGGSNGSDNLAGQIGYAATENLFFYAEASVGDYVEDFGGMTETFKGTSTAVGVIYSF